jgi:two-component system, OmpR family, copper resistance phosphate regulon response regulator CusR
MRILIIEDNPDFQKFLRIRLEERCFAVDTAPNGDTGLYLTGRNVYDFILLDYSLPKKNGYETFKEIRKLDRHTPVIMISGTGDVMHKIDGFNLGLDDYIVKPFFFEELLARINAILRRPPTQYETVLKLDSLAIDTTRQKVSRAGEYIYLTRKEFALLEYLMKKAGNVVTRGELMEHVWDKELNTFSNTIETHIVNLRRKIDLPGMKKLIHSIPSRGYKLDLKK